MFGHEVVHENDLNKWHFPVGCDVSLMVTQDGHAVAKLTPADMGELSDIVVRKLINVLNPCPEVN